MKVVMKPNNQEGAILILLAILSVALILLVGLAIDTGIVSSAKSNRHYATEMAVLAALEAYIAKDPLCADCTDNLSAAVQRAQELIGDNVELMGVGNFLEKPLYSASQSEVAGSSMSSSGGGANGSVYPGTWFSAEPSGGCATYSDPDDQSCPCPGKVWQGNCFSINNSPQDRANAIKIELKLRDDSKLKTLFSRVGGGIESLNFTTTATASIVPRHGLFMVDLSGSVQRDTHRINFTTLSDAGEYAYRGSGATVDCKDSLLSPWSREWDKYMYDGLVPGRGADISSTKHYKDDYLDGITTGNCHTVFTGASVYDALPDTTDKGSGASLSYEQSQEVYLLDNTTEPQPLTNILAGIHTAMEIFEQRAIPKDAFGFIGFDDDVLAQRVLAYDAARQTVDLVEPDSDTVPAFKAFLDATDIANINNKADFDYFLFPRRRGRYYTGGANIGPKTDLYRALRVANRAFNMERDQAGLDRMAVSGFLALFTDGFPVCKKTGGSICRTDDVNYFRLAMNAANEEFNKLRDARVVVHVFLFGNRGGPHALLRKGNNGCMTDEEAREVGEDFVRIGPNNQLGDQGNYTSSANAGGAPFFGANQLYNNAALNTGGMWVPIRPCCRRDADGSCLSIEADLNDLCANVGGALGELVTEDNSGVDEFLAGLGNQSSPSYFDWGRLLCDPTGRDENAQIQFAIASILNNNPIILVQ